MSTNFIFSDEQVSVTKYEYVELLASTPKNPKDYHDLQNILRHRQTMMVKELYGNCRVGDASGFIFSDNTFLANSIWYLDGYRIALSNVPITGSINPAPAEDFSYRLYIKLKFSEVDYTEDSSMAMQDPNTNKMIETSRRVKFGYEIVASSSPISEIPSGWDALYHLATATYSSGSWSFADITDHISLKYNEAIAIVAAAVHKEDDNKTVVIEKMSTSYSPNTTKAFVEKGDTNIGFKFENENNDIFGALEIIYEGNSWYPVLWMTYDVKNYPVYYATPSVVKITDIDASMTISPKEIYVGNGSTKFHYSKDKVQYAFAGSVGFQCKALPSLDGASADKIGTVSSDAGNISSTNASGYEKTARISSGNITAAETAIYNLTIQDADWPTNNEMSINHRIQRLSGAQKGVVNVKVSSASMSTSYEYQYVISAGNAILSTPLSMYINSNRDGNPIVFTIEYEVFTIGDDTQDIVASVGLAENKNISWIKYNSINFSSEVDVIKIGNSLLWIDGDSKLRIKDISSSVNSIEKDVYDLKNNAAGSTLTAAGGKIIGEDIPSFTVSTSDRSVTAPVFQSTQLKMPMANWEGVTHGLLANSEYRAMWNAINGALNSNEMPALWPLATVYVSPSWTNGSDVMDGYGFPYFGTISQAISYFNSSNYYSSIKKTIVLYPGTYEENVNLISGATSSVELDIVAIDPKNTFIKGLLSDGDGSVSVNSFIDCSIISNTSHAVKCTNALSNIIFSSNSLISASNTEYLIWLIDGNLTINGKIESDQNAYVLKADGGTFNLDNGKISGVYGIFEQSSPVSGAKIVINNSYVKTTDSLRPSFIITNNNLVVRNSTIISAGTRSVDSAYDDTGSVNINVKIFGSFSNKGLSGTNGIVTNLISNGLTVDSDVE